MENAGAVTFTETYVFRSKVTDAIKERRVVTILHELAHMWFGDLVTMRWWNDLWLNESFAEWASTIATAEATEWTEAWATFQSMEKSWAYKQDQLPSTHPIVATINDLEDVQVNFDGITYAKGGSVLKQLAAWVGIDAFFAGVGQYFQKHEYGNTELTDLLTELEATSGRDLTTWSKLWLETAGVNTLKPEIETDPDGVITAFRIQQYAPADYATIRPHRLAVGFYAFDHTDDDQTLAPRLVRTHRVELDIDSETTQVQDLVGLPKPDLVLLNDDDLAYAKIRMDDDSWQVAIDHLADIQDPLARALVWGAAWDATRDAEVAPSDYVDLVLGNIATETESTTIRLSLTQLTQVARTYVAPAKQDATIRRVGDALWQLAQDAAPGSDAQFQFVKFFAGIASTTEHGDILSGLRSGSITLEGLEIDTDLSWELLEGLVLVGQAGEAEIDAALADDNTANGQQAAARAKATIPTPDAKLATLQAALTDDTITNVVLRNMGLGFQHVNEPGSLAGTVGPYFDAIARIWKERSYSIASYVLQFFYAGPLASQQLVDATNAWLDANPDVPALRRLVIENLAGVERALAAQARDRQG
jgi:aminopeptidase N